MKINLEDFLIISFQVAIVVLILTIVALVGADAWMKEDIARVEKLKQHIYEVAYGRATRGPAAPTGVRPHYTDKAEPRTRVFAEERK